MLKNLVPTLSENAVECRPMFCDSPVITEIRPAGKPLMFAGPGKQ